MNAYIFKFLSWCLFNFTMCLKKSLNQCCGSKCIEFGSGSRFSVQFGSGSRVNGLCYQFWKNVKNSHQKHIFIRKLFHLKKFLFCWDPEWKIFVFKFNLKPMPLIFPVVTCVDPDPFSEYGSGNYKVAEYGSNLDPDLLYWFKLNIKNR